MQFLFQSGLSHHQNQYKEDQEHNSSQHSRFDHFHHYRYRLRNHSPLLLYFQTSRVKNTICIVTIDKRLSPSSSTPFTQSSVPEVEQFGSRIHTKSAQSTRPLPSSSIPFVQSSENPKQLKSNVQSVSSQSMRPSASSSTPLVQSSVPEAP